MYGRPRVSRNPELGPVKTCGHVILTITVLRGVVNRNEEEGNDNAVSINSMPTRMKFLVVTVVGHSGIVQKGVAWERFDRY